MGNSIIWMSQWLIGKPRFVSLVHPLALFCLSLFLLFPFLAWQLLNVFQIPGKTGVIEYLRRYGYSDYQIYLLLSCAPIQGHVAGIVDIPNACTTIGVPVDIFDFDISPSTGPAKKLDMGSCAFETGVTEGKVTAGGKNSEHSYGGGLTYKA